MAQTCTQKGEYIHCEKVRYRRTRTLFKRYSEAWRYDRRGTTRDSCYTSLYPGRVIHCPRERERQKRWMITFVRLAHCKSISPVEYRLQRVVRTENTRQGSMDNAFDSTCSHSFPGLMCLLPRIGTVSPWNSDRSFSSLHCTATERETASFAVAFLAFGTSLFDFGTKP